MRKNTLRTVLLVLLFLCTLSACNSQTESPATETENKEPSISANQQPKPVVEPEIKEDPPVSIEAEAIATTADILVNGNKVGIGAYNIDGSNYVSIRDLAYVLDGSRASFDVGWDAATKSIALTSGQAYTPNGSELAENSGGKVSAWSIVTPVLLNGEEKMLDGYTVGNVSYFSLKDMSEALDFSMGWFNELRYIVINTEKSYGEEPLTLEEEYKLIVDSRPVYKPAVAGLCKAEPGLCYADYIDFENDGEAELLLVSIEGSLGESRDGVIEVYGPSDGHAARYGEIKSSYNTAEGIGGNIKLYQKDGLTYIVCRSTQHSSIGAIFYPPMDSYYEVKDGAIEFVHQIFSTEEFFREGEYVVLNQDEEDFNFPVTTNDISPLEERYPNQCVTKEQYNKLQSEYQEIAQILLCDDTNITSIERGILPPLITPSVTVNGEKVYFDTELYGESGHLMAPLRPVMEAMGILTLYEAASDERGMDSIIALTKHDTLETYIFSYPSEYGYVFNESPNFSEPSGMYLWGGEGLPCAQKRGETIFAPVATLAEKFGAEVDWDSNTRILSINSNIPKEEQMNQAELDVLLGFTLSRAEEIASQKGYRPEHPGSGQRFFKDGKVYWELYVWSEEFLKEEYEQRMDLSYPYAVVGSDQSLEIEWEGC